MSTAPTVQHRILGTAGHIDHGKSSLVKAFTGVDPDRLPEEKKRGMTIDLGFAQMDISSPRQAGIVYSIGIVDVPGHTDFINNMVSGIGSIDMALLTVAADDGWMPQSEEHLQILTYLGIKDGVIALTKTDLVHEIEPVVQAVRAKLQNSPFSEAQIVPVSVMTHDGIDDLSKAIGEVLDHRPPPADIGKPRLPIDRAFTLPGRGTIVTGTLSGGTLKKNQAVIIQPSGLAGRIRGIQSHNKNLEQALPGMRCALNLDDVAIVSRKHQGVKRGDIVTLAELGGAFDTVNVQLYLHNREVQTASALKHGSRVRWHHGGSRDPARLYLPECGAVAPGETALAQIRFESPIYAFIGDRFILRNLAGTATLAGGTILETNAIRKGYRGAEQVRFLNQCGPSIQEPEILISAMLDRDGIVDRPSLLKQSHFKKSELDTAIEAMRADHRIQEAGTYIVQPAWWMKQIETASSIIDRYHHNYIERKGMPLSELRSQFQAELISPRLLEALIAHLGDQGFIQEGTVIRRQSHASKLPPHLETARSRIVGRLNETPFEPPSRKDLSMNPDAKEALNTLLDSGDVLAVGPNLVLLKEHYEEAIRLVAECINKEGPATISQLREALGTTRRVIVPLAEYLDRNGITIRQGDKRILKHSRE